MKAFQFRPLVKDRLFWPRVIIFTSTVILFSFGAVAEESPKKKATHPSDEQIQIVADKLVTRSKEKFAEFSGNVRASQGNFVITSERLRIYYRDTPQSRADQAQVSGQRSVKRVVANDNVHVTFEEYTAEADQMEYDLDTQIVVLTGTNSKMTSGKNVLTGSKITVNRSNGQIEVGSSPQQRVRAVFHPEKALSEEKAKE